MPSTTYTHNLSTTVRRVGLGDVTRIEVMRFFSDGRPRKVDAWLLRDGDDAAHLHETMNMTRGRRVWVKV